MLGLNYNHVMELALLCCVPVFHDIFLESLYRMYVKVQYGAHIVLLLALKICMWSTIHATLKYNTSLIIGRKWRKYKDHCYYFGTELVKWTTAEVCKTLILLIK